MKKPQIGNLTLKGWAVLAPMAGICDAPFRALCRAQGAALTCTEMVSAKGLYYKNEKTEHMLKISDREHPVSIQLFGSDPDIMALGAREVEKAGADVVDINMGSYAENRPQRIRIRTDEECESGGRYCQSYGKGRFHTGYGKDAHWLG